MTTTSRGTTPPFSSVRHALQAIETIATSGSPRAFIVGTARSGKTSLLREITNLLADLETAFTEYRPGTSAASVPPSRVLVVDDLHLLDEEHLDRSAVGPSIPPPGSSSPAGPGRGPTD